MKRGKTRNLKKGLGALLLVLALAGTGCGDKDPAQVSQSEGAKAGLLSHDYFFGEDGLTAVSLERFLYSDWEPAEFDYICMDPTCSHQTESCSARRVQDENNMWKDFCFVYGDRLIILHSYFQLTVEEVSETVQDWNHLYQTDVYEADLDGSNRRKVASFSGSMESPSMSYAAVLADGKLYFGGPSKELIRMEYDARGQFLTLETRIDDALYCLDLNDYTLETFAAVENKEVGDEEGYQYQVYEFDGMIYGIISCFQGDRAEWYRIDPGAGVCEEILRFDSHVARFQGAIGDTVYYTYENSWDTLYAKDIFAEAEEREIMTITDDVAMAIPFVIDGQILFMTNYCIEGDNLMSEYTVLDPEGNILERIQYDDYIVFLDVVGDRILFFRGYPDSEIWWADRGELAELSEKGVRIGPFSGGKLDTMED